MQGRPLHDPTSWSYQAAVHGRIPNGQDPQFWDQCQHQTWYFLPWHRGYLWRFEEIVRAAIAEMGGPAQWALPYWNYSDSQRANARVLPQAFRDHHLPDGTNNPLHVTQRHPSVNNGHPIGPPQDVSVAALDYPNFVADPHGGNGGFGGPSTGFNHGGGRFGELEATPHGQVHVDIGGWMGDPDTAAADPIFWLHHANIDRLWQIWNKTMGGKNPTAANWRNLTFKLHDAKAKVVTFKAAQMLDPAKAPLAYEYDDLSDPRGPTPTLAPGELAVMVNPDAIPEMVGATSEGLELGATPASTTVEVQEPTGPAKAPEGVAAPEPPEVYLNVENVIGTQATTNYDVYVNLPAAATEADQEQHLAGVLSTFGIRQASTADDEHGGSGLHASFNISELANRLQTEGKWDPKTLRVTFIPRRTDPPPPPATVGRVSVYYKR
jgi:tyrosinase